MKPNVRWHNRVPDDLRALVARFDDDLNGVVGIAASVGNASRDQTPVSYSSLMVAFLWSDDPTSRSLQEFVASQDVSTQRILRHRGISADMRERLLVRAAQGETYLPGLELFSRSSVAMLRNAEAIADETGFGESLGVRHLIAAYAFRNPTFHDQDLGEWGFDTDAWRRDLAIFVARNYRDELDGWLEILRGYLPEDLAPSEGSHAGRILQTYQLDVDALAVLRLSEARAISGSADTMTSERLLAALLESAVDVGQERPDCVDLEQLLRADSAAWSKLESRFAPASDPPTAVFDVSFTDTSTDLLVSRGLRRVLDRARTIAISTATSRKLGIRHLIASILVNPDSTAQAMLAESGVALAELRRELLRRFTRRWMSDDGTAWRLVLVGSTPPTLAAFDADDPDSGDDRLDVTRYATAFATVMAAKGTDPPLSIGIFGDWGSGKSFFMRLMREQAEAVSRLSDVDDDGKRLFCKHVVPIKFNAWHYAETNLWASLVQTIFGALDEAMRKTPLDVMARLRLVTAAREEAERQLEKVLAERESAALTLSAIDAERKTRQRALADLDGKDVLGALGAEILSDDQVQHALAAAEDDLGIRGAKTAGRTVGGLLEIVEQTREQSREVESTLGWLRQAHIRDHLIHVGVGSATVGLAILSVLLHLDWVSTTASAVLGELGLVAAAVTLRAGPLLSGVRRGLDRMASLRGRLDSMQAERLEAHDDELVQAQAAFERVDDQLARAQRAVAHADAEVKQAETEVAQSTSTRSIATLVERRLAGRDYAQFLGVVAAIREDFQTLSDSLSKRASEGEADDAQYVPIDRIVLYIDDLDRCPSDKVVSVMEAVHLMLAFPLFVVVVGVDIRWAGTSLHEHYPKHLDAGLRDDAPGPHGLTESSGASALDYLEKIFQIPFWLPPMEEEASRNVIASMVPVTSAAEPVARDAIDEGDTVSPTGVEVEGAENDADGETRPAESAEAGGAQALFIAAHEREYMLSLASAVGKSPRRLKRFVNTYRILKASCDSLEREKFVLNDGRSGTYRGAMTLLAITTGAPQSSIAILSEIIGLDDAATLDDLDSKVELLAEAHDETEIAYCREALQAYRDVYPESQPTVRDLRYWAAPAARFSFRSGRL